MGNMTEEKTTPEYETVAEAVLSAVSDFFGKLGRRVLFETLGDGDGIALFTDGGGTTVETEDITGARKRVSKLPLRIVYRTPAITESGRLYASSALEVLGRFLEGEAVSYGGVDIGAAEYPLTAEGRIVRITHEAPYVTDAGRDAVTDRTLRITAEYEREL